MTLPDDLAATIEIANDSAQLVYSYFGGDQIDVRDKGVGDVVTAADMASESLILDRLKRRFPSDGVVGEEGTEIGGSSGRNWYVDPLDGTLNFSRALPIWCVSM